MHPSPNSQLSYQTEKEVFFFTSPFYPLDNFSAHRIRVWRRVFHTVEHAYQWKKFELTNPAHAKRIKNAASPELAKAIAYERDDIREDWLDIRVGIMTELIWQKTLQHDDVYKVLLATGKRIIVENSPVDSFWGCGADGKGENQTGKALMQVRQAWQELSN